MARKRKNRFSGLTDEARDIVASGATRSPVDIGTRGGRRTLTQRRIADLGRGGATVRPAEVADIAVDLPKASKAKGVTRASTLTPQAQNIVAQGGLEAPFSGRGNQIAENAFAEAFAQPIERAPGTGGTASQLLRPRTAGQQAQAIGNVQRNASFLGGVVPQGLSDTAGAIRAPGSRFTGIGTGQLAEAGIRSVGETENQKVTRLTNQLARTRDTAKKAAIQQEINQITSERRAQEAQRLGAAQIAGEVAGKRAEAQGERDVAEITARGGVTEAGSRAIGEAGSPAEVTGFITEREQADNKNIADANNDGELSADETDANARLNFITRFERRQKQNPNDPELAGLRARYELSKQQHKEWLASKKQA